MTAKHKLDIFEVLKIIDGGDIYYYDTLSEEEQKSVSMYTLFHWMAGTDNSYQLQALESIVNPFIFSLSKHPKLLYRLMVIASSGTAKRYKWMGRKKIKTKPLSTKAISEFYGLDKESSFKYIGLLTGEHILDIAEALGYDDSEMKKIKKEHD